MLLSFEEFNNLYESNNSFDESYSDGIDVMESLITVINKKGSITDTELHTFLDNVLENTGWELNDEVYENYNEWLEDWSPYIDVTLNEAEDEVEYLLTRRGEALLKEEDDLMKKTAGDHVRKAYRGMKRQGKKFTGSVNDIKTRFKDEHGLNKAMMPKDGKHGIMNKIGGVKYAAQKTWSGSTKGQKIGMGVAGGAAAAGLGYGAYKGIKALRKRRAAKKAAQQQAK
jgi:hypothetical protein